MNLGLPMKLGQLILLLDELDKKGTPYEFVRVGYCGFNLMIDGEVSNIALNLGHNNIFGIEVTCDVITGLTA